MIAKECTISVLMKNNLVEHHTKQRGINNMTTIVIEGCDKIGKTTQCELMTNNSNMRYVKLPSEHLYCGQILRKILNKELPMEPVSFQALMFADQLQVGQYNFNDLWNVVFDRWTPSAFVYGVLKGVDETWIRQLFGNIREPDITIVLHGRPFEIENDVYGSASFQKKVNNRYVMLAKEFGWHLINANQTKEKVHDEIKEIIKWRI